MTEGPAPGAPDTGAPWRALHPRVRLLWWWRGVVGDLLTIAILSAAAWFIATRLGTDLEAVWLALPIGLWLISLLGRRAYVHAAYRAWGYRFGEDHLELRYGVWWKRTASLPYHRLQQVDEAHGPLERWLGMARVQLRSAAATTDASIPGIEADEVDGLRQLLMQRAGRGDGT